jgi:LysM repeat protein/plastocyanin
MTSTNLLHAKRALAVLAVLMVLVAILPPMLQAAPPQEGSIVYYVQFGDTLFSIAQRYGTTVPALMAANGLTSYSIYAGQRLFVPLGYSPYGYQPYSSIFAPQPLPTQQLIANPTFGCPYTVQFRDTVFSIAYRYHVTVPSLMQANNLYTPIIYAGRPLNVPCTSPTPTPFQVYTVQSGDNLFRIAIKYNTTIYALALVNGIPNPSLIFAGQGLVVAYPGSYIWPYIPSPSYAATNVVISQFRTRGPRSADDEFIELYNPTTSSVSIGGWLIKVSNGSGTVDTRVTISSGVQLASGQHYLIANSASDGYNGSVTADQTYTADITDDGGVALTMSDGTTIVDQVGMSSGSVYKEGTILMPLTANNDQAYERKPGGSSGNCTDSNNNASDFYVQAPSEPRDAASAAIAPTCQATPTPTTTATTTATATATATATLPANTSIVVLSGNAYNPNVITITVGSAVQWKNTDLNNHTVSSGTPGSLSGVFQSPTLTQNQTFTFTFNNVGTYPYFDEILGSAMTGTVVVH